MGLTAAEVEERVAAGEVNTAPRTLTRSIPRIIRDNTFTLFNVLNAALFALVLTTGEYRNGLFFLVAVANTFIGSAQEIRAKLTIDRLAVLTQAYARVLRDGRTHEIATDEVVLNDTILLALGTQVCADGVVLDVEGLEVDESLLTGEANPVAKRVGDKIFSGSFVVAGSGAAQATSVGAQSYAQSISADMRYEKKSNSQLMRIIRIIIRVLTFTIVPLGALLFARTYFSEGDYSTAVLGAVAATVGMVPEGLVLLTGVAFAVGAYHLVKHRTLTQSMPSIETLARVDVLCVDKTGTITDGTLNIDEVVPLVSATTYTTHTTHAPSTPSTAAAIDTALREFVATLSNNNETAHALHARFGGGGSWTVEHAIAFSSERKWSATSFATHSTFVLGAPEFVLPGHEMPPDVRAAINERTACGLRVLLFAHSFEPLDEGTTTPPANLTAYALIVFADNIRETATNTFAFFAEQDVAIKVISGDDPCTVSTIAAKAGVAHAERYIDMSALELDSDLKTADGTTLDDIMETYTVFGRTTPAQKQEMIRVLKRNGHTVGMVGDGVNDTRALREADVGVAMASGSDAARTVADFVLIDSDFSSMVNVVQEGRRVVNNIENVASLYLVKTMFSMMLTVLFIFLPFVYPFVPIQLTLVNFFMIGVPSFILTFERNYHPMRDRFVQRFIRDAVPAALLITLNIIVIKTIGDAAGLPFEQTSTLSTLLNGVVGMCLLMRITQPYTRTKLVMNTVLAVGFMSGFILFGAFFELVPIFNELAVIWVPLVVLAWPLYQGLTYLALFLSEHARRRVEHMLP